MCLYIYIKMGLVGEECNEMQFREWLIINNKCNLGNGFFHCTLQQNDS